jgi:hypothetical protein
LPTLYPLHPLSSQPHAPVFHCEKALKSAANATFSAKIRAKFAVLEAILLLFVQFYLALEYASFNIS